MRRQIPFHSFSVLLSSLLLLGSPIREFIHRLAPDELERLYADLAANSRDANARHRLRSQDCRRARRRGRSRNLRGRVMSKGASGPGSPEARRNPENRASYGAKHAIAANTESISLRVFNGVVISTPPRLHHLSGLPIGFVLAGSPDLVPVLPAPVNLYCAF